MPKLCNNFARITGFPAKTLENSLFKVSLNRDTEELLHVPYFVIRFSLQISQIFTREAIPSSEESEEFFSPSVFPPKNCKARLTFDKPEVFLIGCYFQT